MTSTRVSQSGALTTSSARLRRERAVLVLVDLQERLLNAIGECERITKNAALLAKAARILEVPIVVTTQYREGLGDVVPELREILSGVAPIDKREFSCFGCEAFVEWFVQRPGRDQLLIAGVESHVCVFQTVLGALERGLTPHVVADAVGSRTEANYRIGLARMERLGAVITSTEMALYEMLERADGAAFRGILALVKS